MHRLYVVLDYCKASVQAAHEQVFSYLLKARNKHEWTSEAILFKWWEDILSGSQDKGFNSG